VPKLFVLSGREATNAEVMCGQKSPLLMNASDYGRNLQPRHTPRLPFCTLRAGCLGYGSLAILSGCF
jgi:hypothetical protein